MFRRSFILGALIAGTLSGSAGAQPWAGFTLAQNGWRAQQDEARAAVRAGRHVPLAKVLDSIRARTPGRQLDTALERAPDGRPMYRVRWAADNGRRIDYMVDAESGAIVSGEGR